MSFFSNPFKASLKIFKKTTPPIPVINPHNGSPGFYNPSTDNAGYLFSSGRNSRRTGGPTFVNAQPVYFHRPGFAHISPIMAHGGRIMEQ